jgi:LPS-assembly protein
MTARLDLDLVSDQDYLREFAGEITGFEGRPDLAGDFGRPMEERYSYFRRSALRISRDSDNYSLQGSGNYYQVPQNRGNDNTTQPVVGLFYSLLPKQFLKLPLFFNLTTEYNYLWREEGVAGHRFSITPGVSWSGQVGEYINLGTSINYTGSFEAYDSTYQENNSAAKEAYKADIELSTEIERIFSFIGHETTRLKHKIIPGIAYEYAVYPDERDKSPWFESIDLLSRTNSIALTVDNLLDASRTDEVGNVSYFQLARLQIIQRYDIDEPQSDKAGNGGKEVWSPLSADLILRPFRLVNFKGAAEWDHYKGSFTKAAFSANLSVPRSGDSADRYYIDYVRYSDSNRGVNLNADVKLIAGFSAGGLLNRDLDMKYNIHKSLWVRYQAQCWAIRLGVEEENSDRRITCAFQLAGF